MANCTECGGELYEINPTLYACSACEKQYKVKGNKPQHKEHKPIEFLLALADNDVYKLLMLLVMNYVLIEALIMFAKYIFGLDVVLGVFDFIVGLLISGLFYYSGYQLAKKKLST